MYRIKILKMVDWIPN